MSRAEIEAHIATVQAKRMQAAIVYHAGQNAKLEHLQEQARRKFLNKQEQLRRAIEALDKAVERAIKYADDMERLRHEYDLVSDALAAAPKPE